MNYQALIKSTLSPLGLPISFQRYAGKADITSPRTEIQYITFFEYDEMNTEYAENEPIATTYYIQVDLWSKNMPLGTVPDQLVTLMRSAGFKQGYAGDGIEDDMTMLHKILRFNYFYEGDV